MYREPLVVANWKMNTNLADATVLAQAIKKDLENIHDVQIIICPPFVWLYPLFEIFQHKPNYFHLGAQDVYFEKNGAFTGAVSAEMLKDLVDYVIVGHSERHLYFSETEETANKKVKAVIEAGLKAILCVGEEKKINPGDDKVIISQLEKKLDGIPEKDLEHIVIAYEPVWAIGTGVAASGGYANAVAEDIRAFIAKKYSQAAGEQIRILYGGSVKSDNVLEFTGQPEIDGILAGGASLKAKEFIEICHRI